MDLVIPGKNATQGGHHGWSERPGLGWCAEYGINTRSWVEQSPLVAEFYQDDYPDLAGMPWWPQGDFTFLMDMEVPDWTAATVQRIAGVYDQDFSNELWMLFAETGGLHLHVAGVNVFSMAAPAVGVVQIGVRRTGSLVALYVNAVRVFEAPCVPDPYPHFWKILFAGALGGDEGLPCYRGAMSLWEQPLTDAQFREAYADLVSERILNRSFEVAGDEDPGHAQSWSWSLEDASTACAPFYKDYIADRSFEAFDEDAAGHLIEVTFEWTDGAPALFGHDHRPFEAFGPGGWETPGEPWRENGWPKTWPAASLPGLWTHSSAFLQPGAETFDEGWGIAIGAPASALRLRPTYPVVIKEHVNDRLAFFVVVGASIRLNDLTLAPGSYSGPGPLRIALQNAQTVAAVPATHEMTFVLVEPDGGEHESFVDAGPKDATQVIYLARPAGVPAGAPPDARTVLGMPATEEMRYLADPAGASVNLLHFILFENLTTWLNGLGAWAHFSGGDAEDFSDGWNVEAYQFQMESYPVIAVVGGVTPPRVGIAGDHLLRFLPGSGCVAMDEPRIQASYTVVDSILIGPDTYVGMAVADLIPDVGGELYPNQQATYFANGDPDSQVMETFNNAPPVVLWPTDVYP
jgi:hypothetical protein